MKARAPRALPRCLHVAIAVGSLSCASSAEMAADVDVPVVLLAPTLRGEPIDPAVIVESDPNARFRAAFAGVEWGVGTTSSGAVNFFGDETVCVRRGSRRGRAVVASPGDSADDARALLRIDFQSAEIDALERGVDLDGSVAWVLFGHGAGAEAEAHARQIAQALLREGLTRRAQLGAVRGVRSRDVRLLLLSVGAERELTDQLPVAIRGPAVAALPVSVQTLLEGPESQSHPVFDETYVRVWSGDVIRGFHVPRDNLTPRDGAWSTAFLDVVDALHRGCVFGA